MCCILAGSVAKTIATEQGRVSRATNQPQNTLKPIAAIETIRECIISFADK